MLFCSFIIFSFLLESEIEEGVIAGVHQICGGDDKNANYQNGAEHILHLLRQGSIKLFAKGKGGNDSGDEDNSEVFEVIKVGCADKSALSKSEHAGVVASGGGKAGEIKEYPTAYGNQNSVNMADKGHFVQLFQQEGLHKVF